MIERRSVSSSFIVTILVLSMFLPVLSVVTTMPIVEGTSQLVIYGDTSDGTIELEGPSWPVNESYTYSHIADSSYQYYVNKFDGATKQEYRGYLSFDTSSTSDKNVVGVELRVQWIPWDNPHQFLIYSGDYGDSLTVNDWNCGYVNGSYLTSFYPSNGWNGISLPTNSLNTASDNHTQLEILTTSYNIDSNFLYYAESSYPPYLVITYTTTASVTYELNGGGSSVSEIYPEISDLNSTHELYVLEFDTWDQVENVSIDKETEWEFLSYTPYAESVTDNDEFLNLTGVVSATYRVYFAVSMTINVLVHISMYKAETGEGIVFERFSLAYSNGSSYDPENSWAISNAEFYVAGGNSYTIVVMDYFNRTICNTTFEANEVDKYVSIGVPITDVYFQFSDSRLHDFGIESGDVTVNFSASPVSLVSTYEYNLTVYEDQYIEENSTTLPSFSGASDVIYVNVTEKNVHSILHFTYYNSNSGFGMAWESFKLYVNSTYCPFTWYDTYVGEEHNITVKDFWGNEIYQESITVVNTSELMEIGIAITDVYFQFSDSRLHDFGIESGDVTVNFSASPIKLLAVNTYNMTVYEDQYIELISEFTISFEGASDFININVTEKEDPASVYFSYYIASGTNAGEGIEFETFPLYVNGTQQKFTWMEAQIGDMYDIIVYDYWGNAIYTDTITVSNTTEFIPIELNVTKTYITFSDGNMHQYDIYYDSVNISYTRPMVVLNTSLSFNISVAEDDLIDTVSEYSLPSLAEGEAFILVNVTSKVTDDSARMYFNLYTLEDEKYIPWGQLSLSIDGNEMGVQWLITEIGQSHEIIVYDYWDNELYNQTHTVNNSTETININLNATIVYIWFSDANSHTFNLTCNETTHSFVSVPVVLRTGWDYNISVMEDSYIYAVSETELENVTGGEQLIIINVTSKTSLYGSDATIYFRYYIASGSTVGQGVAWESFPFYVDYVFTPFSWYETTVGQTHELVAKDYYGNELYNESILVTGVSELVQIPIYITEVHFQFSDSRLHDFGVENGGLIVNYSASPIKLFTNVTYNMTVYADQYIDSVSWFPLNFSGASDVIYVNVTEINQPAELHFRYYDATGTHPGTGESWESYELYVDSNFTAFPWYNTIIGQSHEIVVMDYFNNELYNETVTVDESDELLEIPINTYSFKVMNAQVYNPVRVEVFFNDSGSWAGPHSFYSGPGEVVERFFRNGSYRLNLTYYDIADAPSGVVYAYYNISDDSAYLCIRENGSLYELTVNIDGFIEYNEIITTLLSPDVVHIAENVPTVPSELIIPIHPWSIIQATSTSNDSGTDMDFYLPYPDDNSTTTILSDYLWISGPYNTQIWVNTTGGTELYNSTTLISRLTLDGQNVTVQANNTISVTRETDFRQEILFYFNYYTTQKKYTTTRTLENTMGYLDMENVYWFIGFPENRSIELSSVNILDLNNDIILEAGKNYDLTQSGIHMMFDTLNATDSRSFTITCYDSNTSDGMTTPMVTVDDYDTESYQGEGYSHCVASWTNGYPMTYTGELNIKLIFENGRYLDPSSIVIVDVSDSHELTDTEFSYSGDIITVFTIDADIGDVYTFDIYFDFDLSDRDDFDMWAGTPFSIGIIMVIICVFLGLWTLWDPTPEKMTAMLFAILITAAMEVVTVVW